MRSILPGGFEILVIADIAVGDAGQADSIAPCNES